jgi:flagellin
MLSIRTNFSSLDAQRNLMHSQNDVDSSMRKLSSGYRITRAADDAAGLAISEKMKAEITGTNQAIRNANDGISLIQTAEGGLGEIGAIVQRVRQLAVQAGNGTLTYTDHEAIEKEMAALSNEISAIANRTKFNGVSLLSGNPASVLFQVGSDTGAGNSLSVNLSSFDTTGVLASFAQAISLYSQAASTNRVSAAAGSNGLIDAADAALGYINSKRADFGASQNRLEHTISVQSVAAENMSAAESRIRDVDVAAETAKMAKSNILMQAGVSVLAQANQLPQLALKLLG